MRGFNKHRIWSSGLLRLLFISAPSLATPRLRPRHLRLSSTLCLFVKCGPQQLWHMSIRMTGKYFMQLICKWCSWCRDYKYSKLHKTWRHRHLSPEHILKAACISVYLYIDSYCLMQSSGMRLLNVSISLFVVTVFEIIIWSVRLETDQAASAVWNINCYLRAILDV